MSEKSEFIQSHLDQVSRSFAFCIRQLPEPLRLWVGVSYLLCRMVDTIEDSDFESVQLQKEAFDWFDQGISTLSQKSDFYQYPENLAPLNATASELELLKDSQKVFEIFWSMEVGVREKVSKLALSMSLGMRHFRMRAEGPLKLKNLKEVNQYCFFVAGVVGEMLVEFISQLEPKYVLSASRLVKAYHFGLFLQKVNLLKDQLKDQKLGRFLVPSMGEVRLSAGENAREAFHFLTELPLEQVEFRRFCAWSLFMGLETLRRSQKISRSENEDLLLEVEERLQDNSRLSELFHSLSSKLGWNEAQFSESLQKTTALAPNWLMGLYKGQLEARSLGALGVS